MNDEVIVKIEIGKKSFGDKTIFSNLKLSISKGEIVSIFGSSGCGKTTLLRIIDGLIKPDNGTVFIDGNPITGPGPERSVVFQNFGLMPWKNVFDNVKFALLLRKPELKEQHNEIAHKYINIVGLAGFENHYPHELSGGMQQRVGFARALSIEPDILLFSPYCSHIQFLML